MPEAVVALGANLGNPSEALQAAADELASHPDIRNLRLSGFYTTSPVDSSGPDYVNAAVVFDTTLAPAALLKVCQSIEKRHGRVRPAGVHNAPRTLDLDVIDYEGVVQEDPGLTIPHPRMHERLFVLVPLKDVQPDYHLADGRSVDEAIAETAAAHPDQKIRALQ